MDEHRPPFTLLPAFHRIHTGIRLHAPRAKDGWWLGLHLWGLAWLGRYWVLIIRGRDWKRLKVLN